MIDEDTEEQLREKMINGAIIRKLENVSKSMNQQMNVQLIKNVLHQSPNQKRFKLIMDMN